MGFIRVERGNVVLDIPSEDKEVYMSKGFSVIDVKTGKVIEEAMSTDLATLQSQVVALKAENAKLKEEIKALKTEKPSSTAKKKSE